MVANSLTNFEAYLCWAIPSLVGFVLNSVVLANILYSPSLRNKYYQQWCGLLALCNILGASAWLMGPKYSQNIFPRILCVIQEYMFLLASLWQAVISLFICYVALCAVVWRAAPSSTRLFIILGSSMFACIILIAGCVYFKTAGLFCSNDVGDLYSNGKWTQEFLMYVSLFIVPIMFTVLLEFVLFVITYRRIKLGLATNSKSEAENNYKTQMLLFTKRMLAYPGIFIFAWSVNIVSIVHSIATRSFNVALGFAGGLFIASYTVLVGLNYFYFQQTYAPFLVHLMRRLKGDHVRADGGQATESSKGRNAGVQVSSVIVGREGTSISLRVADSFGTQSSQDVSNTDSSNVTPNPLRKSSMSSDLSPFKHPEDFYVKFTEFDDNDRFSIC